MPRIIAYARVSTDKQDAENQRFEIERYLARTGANFDEFLEETVSGKKHVSDRKLGQLINELDRGDTLIVSETSRISRRLNEIFNTIQACIDRGITVIAVKQNYVFADDINSKVIAFAFGLAAEIERDLISQRTKEALARKKSEGVTLGRPVGSFQPKHYKLHGKDDEIIALLRKQISVAALARIFEVNRKTMQTYIDDNDLRRKLVI
ncbi:recombinase family protein [Glutamicibacter halophytocola]|uniref:recombinase family protein n=1 Tax=Glutamicibacter halophytocola TaxID=1933880 RepID=UPI0015C57188|nr:recombinase family protein [Glutamicibacter halophytocola]NQD41434.1 recombinase family protein [Glutamicibacter halophytocola]